jgi:hypothetical protein
MVDTAEQTYISSLALLKVNFFFFEGKTVIDFITENFEDVKTWQSWCTNGSYGLNVG